MGTNKMERLDLMLFLVVMALCYNVSNVQGDYFGGMFGQGEVQNHVQSCTEAQDCTNDNETCQPMGFCGTKVCQTKSDCKKLETLMKDFIWWSLVQTDFVSLPQLQSCHL